MRGFSGGIFAGPARRTRTAPPSARRRRGDAVVAPDRRRARSADEALRGLDAPAPPPAGLTSTQIAVIAFGRPVRRRSRRWRCCIWPRGARWARRIGEMEAELADAAARVDRATLDRPQRAADRHRLGPAGRRAVDRGRFRRRRRRGLRRAASSASLRGSSLRGGDRPRRRSRVSSAAARPSACPPSSQRGRHLEIVGRPVSGSAVVRIREVSGDRLEATRMREKLAETEATVSAARLAHEQAGDPRLGPGRRRADALVQRALCAGGRSRRRERRGRSVRRTVRSRLAPRGGGGAPPVGGLETPRRRGGRRRAPNLRGRRSPHAVRIGRRRLRRLRGRRAQGRDGAQRRRLFPHDRPPVDGGGDLRQVEAAHLLQRRLQPDVVARAGVSRHPSDRRRGPRPAPHQAATARAGRTSAPGRPS